MRFVHARVHDIHVNKITYNTRIRRAVLPARPTILRPRRPVYVCIRIRIIAREIQNSKYSEGSRMKLRAALYESK